MEKYLTNGKSNRQYTYIKVREALRKDIKTMLKNNKKNLQFSCVGLLLFCRVSIV